MSGNRMTTKRKIGCVPYLNAKPLLESLDADITLLPPNALAHRFREGDFDAALLPSVEAIREEYEILPGIAIASDGPTDSVLLHHRVPISEIETVALDQNSRTSNALMKILLDRKYALSPRYTVRNPAEGLAADVDATLTIGDLSFQDYQLPYIDLGTEWKDFTGNPFVFALWVCRKNEPQAKEIEKELREAQTRGKENLLSIAKRESRRLNVSEEFCVSYLTRRISYDLGENETKGLKDFERFLRKIEVAV